MTAAFTENSSSANYSTRLQTIKEQDARVRLKSTTNPSGCENWGTPCWRPNPCFWTWWGSQQSTEISPSGHIENSQWYYEEHLDLWRLPASVENRHCDTHSQNKPGQHWRTQLHTRHANPLPMQDPSGACDSYTIHLVSWQSDISYGNQCSFRKHRRTMDHLIVIHDTGLRLALGLFRTSPVFSTGLYTEVNEAPLEEH